MIVESSRISKKSLLLLLLAGVGLGSFFLFLLLVAIGVFVNGSMTISGDLELELPGIFTALVLWPIFTIIWVLLTWLFSILGLRILGKAWPLKVEFRDSLQKDLN
jgi:hypothetical protein